MTAVYLSPSFLDGLVLNHVTYGGRFVRPQYSTAAFETEAFANTSPSTPC